MVELPPRSYEDIYVVVRHDALDDDVRRRMERELHGLLVSELQAVDAGEPRRDVPRRGTELADRLNVEIGGLELAEDVAAPIRARLALRAQELTADAGAAEAGFRCTCMGQFPGRRCYVAETLAGIASPLPWVIALFPTSSPNEALRWRIEDGGAYGADGGSVLIGLATEGVDWAKEMVGWNHCRGNAMWRVHVDGRVPEQNAIYTWAYWGDGCRHSTHTPVFRKPGFLGWWIDVFHLAPNEFWDWCRGKRWTFTWIGDR